MTRVLFITLILFSTIQVSGQSYLIVADRVFDGEGIHTGWAVLVQGDSIAGVGPRNELHLPKGITVIQRDNTTLLPGLIEGHSHLFLYPYNITEWDEQVLKESDSYRTIRATVHAKTTLLAGITTVRDLGTEGAGYSDVALRQSIEDRLIPGPRMLVAGRAIVATGAYGPKGYDSDMKIMLGAESADGLELIRVVRDQLGHGVDIIKVYADYTWADDKEPNPTFSLEELKLVVETAKSAGRPVVAHASTVEGMKRAALAGVETIEHGDRLDTETAQLLKDHHVVLFPTLAATEAVASYRGWKIGAEPLPSAVTRKRKAFQEALRAGVTIGMGGDVGVFAHGENVHEMELMAAYGMPALDVLKAATSVNAKTFHIEKKVGFIRSGLKADLVLVTGDPTHMISDLRRVIMVMKNGELVRLDK